jgi:VanZ family protein
MALFTSDRERRLWLLALAVLAAIYSTLGPAQIVAGALRERNLLRISVAALILLVGLIIAGQWVKRRPGWREIGVAVGVTFVYLWALARILSPEERTHLVEYSVVAIFIHRALLERRRNGGRVPIPGAIALLVTLLLGWLDEAIQALLPNRVYDIRDVGFNTLAALMAITASLALARARGRDAVRDRSR